MAFNKMFIMLPVMFFARKIDGEDPNVVFWLRAAYAAVQCVSVVLVVYTYIQASAQVSFNKGLVYVPPASTPFADPNAKKKYTEVAYGAHVLSTARSLLGSTLFGIALTVGLHMYKGMIAGLAIQTCMAPFNLIENALVKALLLGNGFRPEDKIFEEKTAAELTPDDEVVDEAGNTVTPRISSGSSDPAPGSFEELLLDTWDEGAKADIGKLMEAINKDNCNFRTKENGWTPSMILAGLSAKGVASALRQLKELGGDAAIVDVEGWNALHWGAFHGGIVGVRELIKDPSLLTVVDKDGKTPLELAKAEGNEEVAKILEAAMEDLPKQTSDTGLRKRK